MLPGALYTMEALESGTFTVEVEALAQLPPSRISEIRAGKAFRLHVDAPDEGEARRVVNELCARLLANPVIEDATVSVLP